MEFLLEGYDFIELNKLLKILNLVGSGGEAKMRILEGEVTVNNKIELQIRKKLRKGDQVQIDGQKIQIK